MTRSIDIFFSLLGIVLLSPVLFILLILGYLDTGSPIFKQERMGRFKKPFMLIKFRSMHINAPSVATHLASVSSITRYGSFIRRSKLDELPQLWNVLVGDMSLVGPRPNLLNQIELIEKRDSHGVYSVRPGITGLSQINKIDMSEPELLAETDAKLIKEFNTVLHIKYILITVFGKGFGDRIKHVVD